VLLGAANRILTRDQLLDMSRLHGDDVYNQAGERSGDTALHLYRARRGVCLQRTGRHHLLSYSSYAPQLDLLFR